MRYLFISTTILFYVIILGDAQDLKPNVSVLATYFSTLMKDTLGVEILQKNINNLQFERQRRNGTEFINQISTILSSTILERVTALQNLQAVVLSSFQSQEQSWTPCCKYDMEQLRINVNYKTKVNTDDMCEIISPTSPPFIQSLPSDVLSVMKLNHQQVPNIKWQYVANEQGVMTVYPAHKIPNCTSIDPRFRPWYTETAWPKPKRFLILLDSSRSMTDTFNSKPMIDVARELIDILLETLRPNDKISAIGFRHEALRSQGCFRNQLAFASETNKEKLRSFLRNITPMGESSYTVAFQSAFQLLEQDYIKYKNKSKTEKYVILLISDGQPKEAYGRMQDVYSIIEKQNLKINNSASIFSYAIGRNADVGILKNLSQVSNHAPSQKGHVFAINEVSDVRETISTLNHASNNLSYNDDEPIFSSPYIDVGGLGLILTVALPIHKPEDDGLYGVVAIDLAIQDVFNEAMYFNNDDGSYIFIIDNNGRVVYHPFLPNPTQLSNSVNFFDINQLERSALVIEVVESMKQGGSGNKSTVLNQVLPVGDAVHTTQVNVDLFWKPIIGTKFSICLVNIQDSQIILLQPDKISPWLNNHTTFQYHRLDLSSANGQEVCQRFYKTALVSKTSVLFAPRSFSSPFKYESQEETASLVQTYTTFFDELLSTTSRLQCDEVLTKYQDIVELFAPGVIADVMWSSFVDELWLQSGENHVSARFVGTSNGVDRIYPGTRLPKNIDVTTRIWYELAVAHPKICVFSPPYRDAAGPGNVITISHAIVAKSSKTNEENVIGVVGIDFSLNHLYTILTTLYPNCKEGTTIDSWYCILVDQRGNIVLHKDYVNDHEDNIQVKHIASDNELVTLLRDANFINRMRCLDLNKSIYRIWYTLHSNSSLDNTNPTNGGECAKYFMEAVPNTNMFLVVRPNKIWCFNQGCNSPETLCSNNSGAFFGHTWQCPCSYPVRVDDCANTLLVDSNVPTCPPDRTPVIPFTECINEKIPKCVSTNCHLSKNTSNCTGKVGCTWCYQSSDASSSLASPYCSETEDCYKGVEMARLPGYETKEICQDATASWQRTQTILACVGGCLLLVISIIIILRCLKSRRQTVKQNVDHAVYDQVSPSATPIAENLEQMNKVTPRAPQVIISVVDSDGSEILRKPVQLIQGGVTYGAQQKAGNHEIMKNKNNPEESKNKRVDIVSDDAFIETENTRNSVASNDVEEDTGSPGKRKRLSRADARSRENLSNLDGVEEKFPFDTKPYIPMKQITNELSNSQPSPTLINNKSYCSG
ncbi:VWFA and cache domain-containing protein 1 isoform X3 [Ciona intestinalis]